MQTARGVLDASARHFGERRQMHASDEQATPPNPFSPVRLNGHGSIAQFGPFELSLGTGELRKHGIRIRMQAKPLAILIALLEKSGTVVTREELCARLWPADTFVDFESGLNTAANRLRIGLGDSADMPRYIETLPRVGYRFIAPVTVVNTASPETLPAATSVNGANGLTGPAVLVAETAPPIAPPSQSGALWNKWGALIAGIALAVLVAVAARYLTLARTDARTPRFHQLTFQNGWIMSARFGADANTVIYSRWLGTGPELDLVNTASPESRRLPFAPGALASVSRSGELAIIANGEAVLPSSRAVLSRVPLNGGSPREVATGVEAADWAPDGDTMALLLARDNGSTIEYPKGHVLYTTPDMISGIRFSPTGEYIAFLAHPLRQDDAGTVKVVDMKGNTKVLTRRWASLRGLAWSPSGREVWFAASETGVDRALRAVTLDGRDRVIAQVPGVLRLLDIGRDGRVLLARDDTQTTMIGRLPGDAGERDLSWFDSSHVEDISADGNLVLFTEAGEASGSHYWVYVHNRKLNTTTRIGTGRALALSADGTRAIALNLDDRSYLTLIAVGSDQPRRIDGQGLLYQWARFLPDGRNLLAAGGYPNKPMGFYRQPISGGKPVPIQAGTYLDTGIVSPDGSHVAGVTPDRRAVVATLGGNEVRTMPVDPKLTPVGWTADGRGLYMANASAPPVRVVLVNIEGGESKTLRSLGASNPGGVTVVSNMVVTPNGEYYVYSFDRLVSQVFSLDGVSG